MEKANKNNLPEITLDGIMEMLMKKVEANEDGKKVIPLGLCDPTVYSCFHSPALAQQAVSETLFSGKFNGYAPTAGLPQAREAIAEYLSGDLPEEVSADDVFVSAGCTQAIEIAVSILAFPGANILLPRPGFPVYALCAAFRHLEVRYFDLLPEKEWAVDLDAVESLADKNTIAMTIINPGNPCGNVYTYKHLKQIAETAKKLKLIVIADEVYGHLAFGGTPFVPMGVFASIAPVLTLGSLSKRWLVPGWRLGWLVINDPGCMIKTPKFVGRIKKYFDICGGAATFIQAAVPLIIQQNEEVFFKKTVAMLKLTSDMCFYKIQEIPCLTCSHKPHGSMTLMVQLNLSLLRDISDDIDFCFKLATEESVIVLPGLAVGLKNWVRISFAAEPSFLEEALERIKSFAQRHSYEEYGSY
ncbi:unnamed protein product [Cuscuta epithymum]|uniref:Aminotransferase class I/classII large domain-containing protein n=1 Tax=Cuscuta epithymum TaxID=186058 RepID=A0AAV0DMM3_9ASTE|nr:unnamed protein product [Cuscuta epithymum]